MPITLDGTLGITTPSLTTGSFINTGAESIGGNLTFTSTGQRIIGDFSNSTLANRLMFQTSTSNSNSILSVIPSGTATTTAFQAFNNSDPTNASQADLRVSGLTDVRLSSTSAGSGTYLPLTFYTNGSERMRIDTSGNVGIGVVPSAWATLGGLDISNGAGFAGGFGIAYTVGNAYYNGSNWVYKTTAAAGYTETAGNFKWFTAPSGTAGTAITFTERMRIDSSGNVGIGTASPAYKLDISAPTPAAARIATNDAVAGTATLYLNVANNFSGISQTYIQGIGAGNSGVSQLAFGTARAAGDTTATEAMRIDASGNVGIGTNNPAIVAGARLVLQTATSTTSQLGIDNVSYATGQVIGVDFTVAGGSKQAFTRAIIENGATAATALTFGTASGGNNVTEKMRITSAGYVGIGTTSPSGNLDVYTASNTDVYVRGGNAVRLFISANTYDWKIASNYYATGGLQFVNTGSIIGGFDQSGNFAFNSGYGSAGTAYGCRAWVVFDGSNGSIWRSGNVSSVTYNGTGTGTVNMTTAMPDTTYAVVTGTTDDGAWNNGSNVQGNMSSRTTSYFTVTAWQRAGGGVPPQGFSVLVFR